jgi:hypothetical protein
LFNGKSGRTVGTIPDVKPGDQIETLARSYYTVSLLLEREDVQKWRKYAGKQRWGVRRG